MGTCFSAPPKSGATGWTAADKQASDRKLRETVEAVRAAHENRKLQVTPTSPEMRADAARLFEMEVAGVIKTEARALKQDVERDQALQRLKAGTDTRKGVETAKAAKSERDLHQRFANLKAALEEDKRRRS